MPGVANTGEAILPLRLGPPLPKEDDREGKPPDWLHVSNCPEKKGLEDRYELCEEGKWVNDRPTWHDGQNHVYMTKTKSWAIAVDEDGIHNDKGWLYDSGGAADKKWPNQAKSWNVYDGANWNPCEARVSSCPPPHMNVECDELPHLNGCYNLISEDDADFPMWGHGSKRLYMDIVANRWAICVNPATMQECGGALCSSTEEPPRNMPDEVQDFVYFDGDGWLPSSAAVWHCARPPPARLTVVCPEKKELNGTYKVYKEQINGKHAWVDGENFIYYTKNKAWAACIGKSSAENDQGWLYAKSRESKFPDKVTEWHAYDGKEWSASSGSSVVVPTTDRRMAHTSPVHGQKPPRKPKAATAKFAPEPRTAAAQTTSAVSRPPPAKPPADSKKGLGRMGGDEVELSAARKKGQAKDTAAVTVLPNTRWMDIKPTRSCLEEIRGLGKAVEMCDDIAEDVETKIQELKFTAKHKINEFGLDDDDLCALAAYTHDLQNPDGSCSGNFYFEMNKSLRVRAQNERKEMMESWGFVVHYIIKAMSRLPDWKGECYRGIVGKDEVLKEYEMGRPIQWGAFTSVTTMWDAAALFCDPADGVIFKIQVTNGRRICDFSFFPAEDEILLTPSHRFIVSSDPYEMDGFTVIDLVQQTNKVFVS